MTRFLSAAWFDELTGDLSGATAAVDADKWVVEQVVTGTPEGEVHYHVAVSPGAIQLRSGRPATADLTFTSDYPTASAIVRGELSTQAALLEGRIRVSGSLADIAGHIDQLADVDLVPEPVRASTTY